MPYSAQSAYWSVEPEGQFDSERLYAHPGNLNDRHPGTKKTVGVVGAGLAGLVAAYELSKLGHRVHVFEATSRCGGRIDTCYFNDGSYGELGAMRIPPEHACVLHYVHQFGLATRRFVSVNGDAYRYMRGVKRRLREWNLSRFPPHEAARWSGLRPEMSGNPGVALSGIVDDMWKILSVGPGGPPDPRWQIFEGAFTDARLRTAEAHSVWQGMTRDPSPLRGRLLPLAQQEWEYLSRAEIDRPYEGVSLLSWFADRQALSASGKLEIIGGMMKLVEHFLQRIQGFQASVQLDTVVQRIRLTERNVQVCAATPTGDRTYDCDYVICAVPAAAVASMEFEPPLAASKFDAVSSLGYFSAAKTLVRTTKRFWEKSDGIAGGGSYTDLANQQCWYPSDNAQAATGAAARFKAVSLDPDEPELDTWTVRDPEVSENPGVFIAAYMWGIQAKRFASLSIAERDRLVLENTATLHPWLKQPNAVDTIVHRAWDTEPYPGGGAYACFTPGDQTRYQDELTKPFPSDRPRVFFAGEHLAILHGWLQGAVQTGLAAAQCVLNA